jgi:2-polyprenyl-3-methyl-5-hydroxy-6-metoxy-1,4-benzoquinol methylase
MADIGVHRPCKLCSSDHVRVLYLSYNHGFPVGRCSTCGFVFVLKEFSEATLKEMYSDEAGFQAFIDASDDSQLPARNQRALRDLLDHLPRMPAGGEPRLLDVGAGSGSFLDQARANGFDVYGNELSDAGIAAARQKYGIELTPQLLEDDPRADFFDVITMWGLLEHVADPRVILESAFRLLRAGGVLFVYTPAWCLYDDIGLMVARLTGNRRTRLLDRRISQAHLQLFSTSTLQTALCKVGFEPEKVETVCEYNFKTAVHVRAMKLPRILEGPVTAVVDGMITRGWFFRNNMRVIYRKPRR